MTYHLCQVNIAKGRFPLDHPEMAGFTSEIDRMNELAEKSPGFIWRLKSAYGNATDIQMYEDPLIIYNMSVWESVEALFSYTYATQHTQVMKNRKQWFHHPEGPFLALWWTPAGTTPKPDEGKKRLEHLTQHGPTPHAFTFKQPFPSPLLTP